MANPRHGEPLSPILELTRARLLEFVRDPSALFWTFGFPILLAIALGIAFRNQGPEVAHVAVTGQGAALLVSKLPKTDTLHLESLPADQADRALRTSKVELVVVFDGALDAPAVTYRFDPTRPNAAAVHLAVDDIVQRALGRADVVKAQEVRVAEPGGRYIDFLVPGLIGLNVMGSCMWGLGYAVVDARRRKLLRRFAVTPMNRSHFLSSFALSRLLFLAAEVIVLTVFGWLAFDIAVRGAIAALVLTTLLGAFAFSGLALLIAARTASTETAAGWMNFVQMPMWLLGGSFFSYSRFPEVVHPFIKALPLTALNDALRAIINDGSSLPAIWLPLAVLALWGLVGFTVALRIFRWQ